MTLNKELKITDDKIKAIQSEYDKDREGAKISAISLDKHEYLTLEDLGYKPGVGEQAKFEYSSLGEIFNRGLDERNKKEGLLKRLKNVEDIIKKHLEKQLKPI